MKPKFLAIPKLLDYVTDVKQQFKEKQSQSVSFAKNVETP